MYSPNVWSYTLFSERIHWFHQTSKGTGRMAQKRLKGLRPRSWQSHTWCSITAASFPTRTLWKLNFHPSVLPVLTQEVWKKTDRWWFNDFCVRHKTVAKASEHSCRMIFGRLKKKNNLPCIGSTIASSTSSTPICNVFQLARVEMASLSPQRSFRKSISKQLLLKVSPQSKSQCYKYTRLGKQSHDGFHGHVFKKETRRAGQWIARWTAVRKGDEVSKTFRITGARSARAKRPLSSWKRSSTEAGNY